MLIFSQKSYLVSGFGICSIGLPRMDSSFWFDIINLGESFVHIQGCQGFFFSKNIVFFCLKIFFTFTPSQTV